MKGFRAAVLVGMLVTGISLPAVAEEAKKDLFLKGDARCTQCHDEADDVRVLAIGKTKHGVGADKRTPTCTSCHGDSDAHVKDAGRAGKVAPKVDVGYTKRNPANTELRNEKCLSCHDKDSTRHFWGGSVHQVNDVACTSCHNMHTGKDKVRDRQMQAEVCFTCHKEQRAQVSRPSHHPVMEGKVICSDCHSPHGTAGVKLLARGNVNDTCYTCHMEKRGPFINNHQPVNEDCAICHNPHGTVSANMLKARPPFLCQECHAQDGHPGQLGILPTTASGGFSSNGSVARGCVNCHTNIHGDNNPNGNTATRRFLR